MQEGGGPACAAERGVEQKDPSRVLFWHNLVVDNLVQHAVCPGSWMPNLALLLWRPGQLRNVEAKCTRALP